MAVITSTELFDPDSEFGKALISAGIPANCRRIVIDIAFDDCVKVFYETFAEPELLDIVLPHVGAMIKGKG